MRGESFGTLKTCRHNNLFKVIMTRYAAIIALLAFAAPAMSQEAKNVVFDELVVTGVQVPGGPKFKLPPPLLMPGKEAKVDDELLEKAAGKVPVELFLKKSLNAPFSLKIDSVDNTSEQRVAQLVNLRFVLYGKMEDLLEGDVFKQILGGEKKKAGKGLEAKTTLLSPEELTKRGIRLLEGPNVKDSYGVVAMPLLDKVQIDGVTRSLRTTVANALLYATILDERFSKDKEYPNVWRHIMSGGELGPEHPYAGLGGFVVVTPLAGHKEVPPNALLVELVYLLHEPYEWFDGHNILRAKLPVPLQENVRSFRRKLQR